MVDYSLRPPCAAKLHFHIARPTYVANVYRNADQLQLNTDSPVDHGWDAAGNALWNNNIYPDNVAELLLNLIQDAKEDSIAHHSVCVGYPRSTAESNQLAFSCFPHSSRTS